MGGFCCCKIQFEWVPFRDPVAAWEAPRLIGEACRKHGFFLFVNHGVKARLVADAHRYMDMLVALLAASPSNSPGKRPSLSAIQLTNNHTKTWKSISSMSSMKVSANLVPVLPPS
uniref:Non-haem dioxygenase N-terminal domain-containing protein n=1 Tax=Nelumbo nucifera TaxID=4432 RepID=A0A822YVR0_NELNU|nr:TPA_asm: hypothetical protein HUJ06_006109 [Nelumbo nucifera]